MPTISHRGEVMPASPIRKLVPLANKAKEKGLKEGLKQGLFEGKLESARSFLDILDDDTIATKLNIDVDIIKTLRIEI